jgi:hypothetical protein
VEAPPQVSRPRLLKSAQVSAYPIIKRSLAVSRGHLRRMPSCSMREEGST